jgi:GNAT superfamily N-acetyltransferase
MAILLQLMQEFNAFFGAPFDAAAAAAALEGLIVNESAGRAWLIESDGQTVGYVVLTYSYSIEFHGRDAFVDELYVRETYRGRGLGTAALEFVEGLCPSLGVRPLHLEVDDGNDRARTVYRKFGFQERRKSLMTKRIAAKAD